VGAKADGSGAIMFDVGAHVGETALALALEFPAASIHAFEPVQVCFNQLQKNCRNYKNVVCHPVALGDQNETRAIALRSNNVDCTMNQVNRLADQNTPSEFKEIITIQRIDDVCSQLNIDQIAFLKIDVEGFELEVLRGANRMLKSQKIKNLIAEVTFEPKSEQHIQFEDLRAMLTPFGYIFAGFYDSTYRRDTGRLYFTNALFVAETK
jgi:FkbM family methyltransferase